MRKFLLAVLVCTTIGTYSRAAEVLVSTFGPNYGLGNSTWVINAQPGYQEAVGVPFTPSHVSNLIQIDLGFYSYAPVNNLQIDLTTDNSGAPGTVLESWLLTLTGAYTGPYIEALLSTTNPVFQGGSQYWIFVSAADNSTDAGWFSNPMDYENTVAFNVGYGWATATLNVPVFDVVGTSSSVPEPSGILLLATGLAGCLTTRLKKFFR